MRRENNALAKHVSIYRKLFMFGVLFSNPAKRKMSGFSGHSFAFGVLFSNRRMDNK
jgi:hypothetical protein